MSEKEMDAGQLELLIVDDSDINRAILVAMLEEEFKIREAGSGEEAIQILTDHSDEISLVLLDVLMPDMNGFDVLTVMNEKQWIKEIPVIMVSSADSMEFIKRAYELGATDYINRTMDGLLIQKRISNVIRLFGAQRKNLRKSEEERESLVYEKYLLENKDELTGCWSFNGFKKQAEDLIRNHPENAYSLWYCDIKQFKFINETFGYDEGDRLLQYWVEIVTSVLNEEELMGRISADNFVVLTCQSMEWEFARRFEITTEKLRVFFNQPGISYDVEVAAGVYLVKPEDITESSINRMLDFANVAQQEAKKQSGTHFCVYTDELWKKQVRMSKIRKHLKAALANGEISVWMQPQYNYVTGEMVGAEALCRWNHKNLGNISPAEFIPVLERTSQVTLLDRYVWEEVCKHMRKWQDEKMFFIGLSVNISRIDIQEEGFYEYLKELVAKYDIEPSMLHLEITESAYMDNSEQVIEIVERLQQDGFIVEMDDFGSGYSSLNMLKEVPVDILKLDIRFLSESAYDSARGGNILSAVIRMAHSLNLPVIAEGVETIEQADFLKNLGCQIMQGYYFSRPMPMDEFEELLRRQTVGELPTSFHGEGLWNLGEILEAGSSSGFIFDRCIGPAMLLEFDGEHLAVLMANDALFDTLQVDREQFSMQRQDLLAKMRPEYRERLKQTLWEAVETGSSRGSGQSYGDSGWAVGTYRLISSGAYSHILFAMIEDITLIHKMESEVTRLNEEIRSFMDRMPGGMFRFEAEGEQMFSRVGNGLLEMLGYTRDGFTEKFGQYFPNMIYEEDRERVLKEIQEQTAEKDYCSCIHRIECADGKIRWYYASGHIVREDSGKAWFYVMIIKWDKDKLPD